MAPGQDAKSKALGPLPGSTLLPHPPHGEIHLSSAKSGPELEGDSVCLCVRGLDGSLGGRGGKLEPAPATPGETGNRRRRVPGPVPGGQAPSQASGQGCQWGEGQEGAHVASGLGRAPPTQLPFRDSDTPPPTHPTAPVPS